MPPVVDCEFVRVDESLGDDVEGVDGDDGFVAGAEGTDVRADCLTGVGEPGC